MANKKLTDEITLHKRTYENAKCIVKIVAALASLLVALSLQWDTFTIPALIHYLILPLLALVTTLCILSLDKQKKIRWWLIPILFSTMLWIQNLNTLRIIWDLPLDSQTNRGILVENLLIIIFQLLANTLLALILTKLVILIRRKVK